MRNRIFGESKTWFDGTVRAGSIGYELKALEQ